ncbi:MAG: polyprenyl synthetase [Flavobacteriia bacterium]|nr:MAG: polyprenyl synthetase [Flavobacteriia bacterium]
MKTVEKIKEPIRGEMELFESKFSAAMHTKVPLLNRIMNYIVHRKGKQMRPMFVFLTAKMVTNGGFHERTYRGASIVELIHTATLVHDDVVDDSNMRRGFFSINALWKNKIAVLVGDFLLSKGVLLSVDNEDFDLLKIISRAVREMSEGELLQIEKARRLDITEEVYFDIIRQKTATLIGACTAIGAASVGAEQQIVDEMWEFGETIGLAFQIKDDLFDYSDDKIGKPTGIDIKEQKMTLPLIYAINNASKKDKKWLINTVKNHNKNKKKVKEVIDYVQKSGGIDYTINQMRAYQSKALDMLKKYPDTAYRQALESMINYVVDRPI